MSAALCVPEAHPPVDLADIDGHASATVVATARALCNRCPILATCRGRALRTTDVAGFAGGMTEAERAAWRTKHKVRVDVADIIDVTPAHELTSAVLDDLPRTATGLHPRVVKVVIRMTTAGVTADDIVARLAHPAVTHRTVNYIRHRFAKGLTRVDA